MNDKYAKEIAKELRLIRIELQKQNKPIGSKFTDATDAIIDNIEKKKRAQQMFAGERVTIK